MKSLERQIDAIIGLNKELVTQMEQCPSGDLVTLFEIKQELEQNNKEIMTWINNIMEDDKEAEKAMTVAKTILQYKRQHELLPNIYDNGVTGQM
jgi:antirestriction protein ArdC